MRIADVRRWVPATLASTLLLVVTIGATLRDRPHTWRCGAHAQASTRVEHAPLKVAIEPAAVPAYQAPVLRCEQLERSRPLSHKCIAPHVRYDQLTRIGIARESNHLAAVWKDQQGRLYAGELGDCVGRDRVRIVELCETSITVER